MTDREITAPSARLATGTGPGTSSLSLHLAMPLAGLMVRPFPEPGPTVRAALERLQHAALVPPATELELHQLAQLPRPWDPAGCTGQMRSELWAWLDLVAMWINEEHLWSVTRPGIPECWPDHPHLVHDLAALACSRYIINFATTPSALAEWHAYDLVGFLERLRDRLGDACQPGRHQSRPRRQRDESHVAVEACLARKQRQEDDVRRVDDSSRRAVPSVESWSNDDLHNQW